MWRPGLVAPQHVGSSRIRDRTRVACIGRRILNHCATRKAPVEVLNICELTVFIKFGKSLSIVSSLFFVVLLLLENSSYIYIRSLYFSRSSLIIYSFIFFSTCVLFGIFSITSSVINLFSRMSYLPLVPSSVFFISEQFSHVKILIFTSKNPTCNFYIILCLSQLV